MKICTALYYHLLILSFLVTIFYCDVVHAESISEVLQNDSIKVDDPERSELENNLLNLSLPSSVDSAKTDAIGIDHSQHILPPPQKKRETKSSSGESQNMDLMTTHRSQVQTFRIDNQAIASKRNSDIRQPSDSIVSAWQVKRGELLFNILSQWCADAGWSLVWKADASYRVLSAATFQGDFMSAVKQLFSSMGMQSLDIYIRFYTGNKVLVVTSESFVSE